MRISYDVFHFTMSHQFIAKVLVLGCDHGPGLARSGGLVVLLTDLVGILAFKRPSQTADERPSPAFVRFSIQNATRHYASALSGCNVGFETFFPKPRAIETRGAKMIEKALHMGVAKKKQKGGNDEV